MIPAKYRHAMRYELPGTSISCGMRYPPGWVQFLKFEEFRVSFAETRRFDEFSGLGEFAESLKTAKTRVWGASGAKKPELARLIAHFFAGGVCAGFGGGWSSRAYRSL